MHGTAGLHIIAVNLQTGALEQRGVYPVFSIFFSIALLDTGAGVG